MNTQNEETKNECEMSKLFDGGTLFGEKVVAGKTECTQYIKCKAMYGHLWNIENERRIIFVEGSTCELHHAQYKYPSEDTENIQMKIKADYTKVLDKYTVLDFELLQHQEGEKDEDLKKEHKKYCFTCMLLDDLYAKQTEKEGYRLHPCQCKTIASNVLYFEPITGKTLSELFRKTSILYNEGYTCANVKVTDRFFLKNGNNLEKVCNKVFGEHEQRNEKNKSNRRKET